MLGVGAAPARGAFLYEFPHPPIAIQLHPRSDRPFTLGELERALRLGVHAVELDLRWRPADSRVVCGHGRRGLAAHPTLEEALDAIVRFQGRSPTVQKDGLQFFIVLDLKDETPAFHRALVRALGAHSERLSTSGRAPHGPRGITVVVSGFRAALERSIPPAALDTLALVEGRDYAGRIRNLSGSGGRFQWVALEAPVDRSRIEDIHQGRDARFRGRFNVRVVAAHRLLARTLACGPDAVNADLEEIEAAVRGAATARPASRDP